jgi:thiosulfate dehydrogenase (quinone) large subunit
MMVPIWAEWPLAKVTSAGEPSMSTNPIVDYHIIYALALIALAVTYAGHTWGLGRVWARLPFVQRNRWLISSRVGPVVPPVQVGCLQWSLPARARRP